MLKKITREEFIRIVAREARVEIKYVRKIYDAIEDSLFYELSEADEDNEILIKLFNGISVKATYSEECKNRNICNMDEVKPSIRAKFNVTRNYKDKLNEKY